MRRIKISCGMYRKMLLGEVNSSPTLVVKYTGINGARVSEEINCPVTIKQDNRDAIHAYYERKAKREGFRPVSYIDFWDRNIVLQKV